MLIEKNIQFKKLDKKSRLSFIDYNKQSLSGVLEEYADKGKIAMEDKAWYMSAQDE